MELWLQLKPVVLDLPRLVEKMPLRLAPRVAEIELLLLPPLELVCEDVVPSVIVTTLVIIPSLNSFLNVETRSSYMDS